MSKPWINHNLISYLKDTMHEAGELALHFRKKGIEVYKKPDNSPVSNADIAISDYIYSRLKDMNLDVEIICEEKIEPEKDYNLENHELFWLVDPIDGTSSYIKDKDSFTVNIALIQNKQPKLGFILQPTQNILYYTDEHGVFLMEKHNEAYKPDAQDLGNDLGSNEYIAIVSSNHFNSKTRDYIENHNFAKIIPIASSIKLCFIADGTGDAFPKFGPTMEWDIAAGHALINASGGRLEDFEGKEMTYAKKSFKNPHFLASGKKWQSR